MLHACKRLPNFCHFKKDNGSSVCTAANIQASWGRHLSGLASVDLANTRLNGQLPAEWSQQMTQLQLLDLSFNDGLVGAIPRAWAGPGAFPSLQYLLLGSCSLRGALPGEQ